MQSFFPVGKFSTHATGWR